VIAVPTVLGISAVLFNILALTPGNPFGELALNPDIPTEEKEFVEAARCIGVPGGQLIVRHILPNALSSVIVNATLGIGSAILAESSLSLLGFGFRRTCPPGASCSPMPATPWISRPLGRYSQGR
jgi:peptide/nickel transport system permease protein